MTFSHIKRISGFALALLSTQVFAVAPTAVDDTRRIPVNSSITLNILANDFDADGDAINVEGVTQPANGTVVLNGDGSVFYTAPAGFSGDDTFTYTLGDNSTEGLTSTGTVTITVLDSNFPTTNVGGNDANLAGTLNGICDQLRGLNDAALGASQRQLLDQCNILETLRVNNPELLAEALNQLAPEEALSQMRAAVDSNRTQVRTVAQRVQQFKSANRSSGQTPHIVFNGRAWAQQNPRGAGASSDTSSIWSKLGIFANFQAEESERERSDLENGYESDTTSATLGADYFINQSLLVGSTISVADSELDYSNDGGKLESDLTTFTAFSAFFYQRFSFYVQAGYSWMDFDSRRLIRYGTSNLMVDQAVTSNTNGRQKILNTRADWEWNRKALRLTPFIRADYLDSEIKGFGEQGNGGLAMEIGDQNISQLTLSTGLQAAYTLNQSWGVWVPTLNVTFLSEAESDRDPVFSRFAADPSVSRGFTLNNDGGDTEFFQVSLGASAVFKHGFSGFAEYTETLGYSQLSASSLQLGIRYEL